VQRAPDGTLWTSDSHSLLQLSKDGKVERILGQKPGEGGLTRVRAGTVDSQGRIYAVNERDASVYVFDKTGKELRVLRPDPTDFDVEVGLGSITVGGAGEVYYFPSEGHMPGSRHGYLHFDAEGKRKGFESFVLNQVAETWLFKPGSQERWAVGYSSLALVGADGTVIREIKKKPDGDWLEGIGRGAVAPDGSLAVISTSAKRGMRGPLAINIYSPTGEPVRTLPLEGQMGFARLTFTPSAILSTDQATLQVHPLDGRPVKQFTLPVKEGQESWWSFFASPNSHELWGWNTGATELCRFAMP
jgi:hypothetical protein